MFKTPFPSAASIAGLMSGMLKPRKTDLTHDEPMPERSGFRKKPSSKRGHKPSAHRNLIRKRRRKRYLDALREERLLRDAFRIENVHIPGKKGRLAPIAPANWKLKEIRL